MDAKARILAAADDLFARHGQDGVSARDVAAAAGVTKAAVFYHYGGMEALYAAVLDRYYTAHGAALFGALDASGSPQERVHRLLDAYLDFMAEHTRYARMVQRQLASGDDPGTIGTHLAALLRGVESALGDLVPAQGPLAAAQFFVTLSGAVINTFTYAPALAPALGADPLSAGAIATRREHLHWLADAILARLAMDATGSPR
jgi:AcrR family transcriptional regulator